MTIEEIRNSDKETLVPRDIAEVLGVNPYSINCQAKEDISKLGFHASLIGTRVIIPRAAFVAWFTGE